MPSIVKKHLQFAAWPEKDRALWVAAFEQGDVFDEDCPGAHLAVATKIGLRSAYSRYLGFLASDDAERLHLGAEARLDRNSIRRYIRHFRQTCGDTTIASTLHKLWLTLGLMCPKSEWAWLKTVAKRIDAQAIPMRYSQKVTSAQLFALGVKLMAEAENSALAAAIVLNEDALTYRDGLIIALLACVPLRRRTLASLTINQHLLKIGGAWLLDIPAVDTKTRRPLEFPIPHALSERINLYLVEFRGALMGANMHQGLWPSAKGQPMNGGAIYDAVRRRTIVGLGFPVNLHRFRVAAGNLWSISDPVNVRGVKDLLGHSTFGTTERHYIGAQSRSAGRALAKMLRPSTP